MAMLPLISRSAALAALSIVLSGSPSFAGQAQQPQPAQPSGRPVTVCGVSVPPPPAAQLPPAGSGPVLWQIAPCFAAQGNVTLVDFNTYLYYIQLQQKRSRPTEGIWTPYDDSVVDMIRADFQRLWNTNFLDNLSIEKIDYTFANGVVGEIVVYNMEERQRVKIVSFNALNGTKKPLEDNAIYDKLRELKTEIRVDTFIDPALLKKVSSIVRDMLKEKGFQSAEVTNQVTEIAGGPKQVNVTFILSEGPKVKIRKIEFEGNRAASDGALKRRMKNNKQRWFLSWLNGRGTYQEAKFEEDADRVMQYYLDRGYIQAQVGAPEIRVLADSPDKKSRFVELRIPVTEGKRYRVGNFEIAGNIAVKTEALKPLFKVKPGEYYSQSSIRKGFEKAKELYGAGGYMQFTGYPDNRPRDLPDPTQPSVPETLAAVNVEPQGPPIVDVTMRIQEGKQYFVNRITFVGNTTTRDNVIRREMRLYENNIFNSEALKFSIRRLNQLGYFKALEGPPRDVTIDPTPNQDNKVDVRMQLEEQNRNQLSFGAGVSQFEGFFGQLSFQTSNFLGRGESLTVAMMAGARAHNYTLSFTEPFLFDRNVTGGLNLFRQEVRYINQFTQRSTGGALTFGFPLGRGFTRMFTNYSYEQVRVTEINELFTDPLLQRRNPFLSDSLLIGAGGERIISKVTPSLVYNTVDQPIFPTTGRRFTASIDLAGLGGNTNFYKPLVEGVWIQRQNNRMSLAMRGQVEYIQRFSGSKELPIFEKLFLGGEYSIRGFDIRSIGPKDPVTNLVLGGNKSLLFNVEQNINIAGPVRLIFFFDAGQVRDSGHRFSWKEDVIEVIEPPLPLLTDYFASSFTLTDMASSLNPVQTRVIGQANAFKSSTGAEIRFFMPVLNVPFRLIFAENLSRVGVLNNQLRPQKAFQFRFAVGTTF
jgi:outer membrane protein insertion porin family